MSGKIKHPVCAAERNFQHFYYNTRGRQPQSPERKPKWAMCQFWPAVIVGTGEAWQSAGYGLWACQPNSSLLVFFLMCVMSVCSSQLKLNRNHADPRREATRDARDHVHFAEWDVCFPCVCFRVCGQMWWIVLCCCGTPCVYILFFLFVCLLFVKPPVNIQAEYTRLYAAEEEET